MVWCTMILSQYVIVQHITGCKWENDVRRDIIHHYETWQNPDGSWGLHPESHGYVFTTTLAYVALRLLGVPADDPMSTSARVWLREKSEGVLANPTWGKFWLSLLDLYDRDGVHPLIPELFLLPRWLPMHPLRYYCHTRYIYLAIAFLSGIRFCADLGPLKDQLRSELYGMPYDEIEFSRYRDVIAKSDLYVQPSALLRCGYRMLRWFDRLHLTGLRRRASDFCYDRILYEQRATNYQGISPVNGLLNCLAIFARDKESDDLSRSLAGLEKWQWRDEKEGIRYAGARSQTWDTAFAMQTMLASPNLNGETIRSLQRGYAYLRDVQMTHELPDIKRECRDSIVGGWCFSDGRHRWPVSDCTAEALCPVLQCHERDIIAASERISETRLAQAAQFLLNRQNDDGGFGTYERRRGPTWLESFNPSEMYGACMVEGSYLECTGSVLCALAAFRRAHPNKLGHHVDRAMAVGAQYLIAQQRPDGSWPGFWGVNMTYAIFHVVKALRSVGLPPSHAVLQKAVEWLISQQKTDGGWGEHHSGCLTGEYVEHEHSQPVMTAWALLAMTEVLPATHDAIRRGVQWLEANQEANGGWKQDAVTGVFFGTAMLDYRMYKAYFPTWALAQYERRLRRSGH